MADLRSSYRGKRLLDLTVLALATLPALLVATVCAAAIYWEDRNPVLLRQTRTGRDGQPFTLFKLRTMAPDTAPEAEVPDADRITQVGRVLRRLSLDELPQLINVARGEMSLVGPRPAFGHRTQRYDAYEWQRLRVRPGLTGLAQVRGRNRLSWRERTEHDLCYVAQQSLLVDLRILVYSIWVVLAGDGIHGHPSDNAGGTVRPASSATPAAGSLTGSNSSGWRENPVAAADGVGTDGPPGRPRRPRLGRRERLPRRRRA
jgi:lipopolysaccharide/colanic/teichoic acid biosynthesis glycosyltransferase